MKEYRGYEFASIQMADDERLKSELKRLADENRIEYIVESGAFLGLGSTTMLAEAFKRSSALKKLFTIEINHRYFSQAKQNLKKYPFVECCYGCSLEVDGALEFIRNDEAIRNHGKFPDIYIDTLVEPVDFYSRELTGFLHAGLLKRMYKKIVAGKKPETGLLTKLISAHSSSLFLVVLDSAGGTGYLEYQTVKELLKDKKYYLMLDDVHHLKHFRSYADVKNSSDFKILAEDYANGWVIAEHSPGK